MVLAALQMAKPALPDTRAYLIAGVTVVLGLVAKINPVFLIIGAGVLGAVIY
jgi:chromate transport protein ChrA